jgi:light-regulated signal transduction histidine kinase (bacteriophytochrome)
MTSRSEPAHDCASEQIEYPSAIQPHGYLVSCVLPDWTIRHVSANVVELFDVPADVLLGQSLQEFLTQEVLQPVSDVANLSDSGAPPLRAVTGNVGPEARLFDISVHIAEGLLHLEFEPREGGMRGTAPSAIAQSMIARVAAEERIEDMYQRAVEQLRKLIDFDRVLVYRFLPDGAGEVIAEARADDISPLMGLRFPESDIPAQARALYVRNRMRIIPDVGYTPSPVIPPVKSPGRPLDMSMHLLRSVSPVHLEYTRNMGVAASMSLSLISGGRLWGLIACHHREPRYLSASKRAAAELFGLFLSMRVSAHDQHLAGLRDELSRDVRETLWRRLSATHDLDESLASELESLAMSLNCDGVAVLRGDRWSSYGDTPAPECAPLLQSWLASQLRTHGDIIVTSDASTWCAAECGVEHISGLLALRLGARDGWLLFFRNEQVQNVNWAGEPVKQAQTRAGRMVVKPRERFEAWNQIIRGHSLPWSDLDRRMAERLRHLLNEFRSRSELGAAENLAAYQAEAPRVAVHEQRSRLEQLSTLLGGLGQLDAADAARLAERISLLEAEMRALAGGALPDFDPDADP